MDLRAAQKEMRDVFLNGSVGQLVSGVIWLAAAALGTWGTPKQDLVLSQLLKSRG
jgi:hypothetical protein